MRRGVVSPNLKRTKELYIIVLDTMSFVFLFAGRKMFSVKGTEKNSKKNV